MISNFDEVKRQLSELSEVINTFNSEAVQLRIVEIVLGDGASERDQARLDVSDDPKPKSSPRKKRKAAIATTGKPDAPSTTKARPRGQGAGTVLNDLIEAGFFSKPKTIGEIVAHSEEKLARKFKSSAFSPPLARATRAGALSRSKNADGQYEYSKP